DLVKRRRGPETVLENPGQDVGAFSPALGHIDLRVGLPPYENVGNLDHAVRHVRVEIELRHDRNLRADEPAHRGQDVALGIVDSLGDYGAMPVEHDASD